MDDRVIKFAHEWKFGSRRKARDLAKEFFDSSPGQQQIYEQMTWYSPDGLIKMADSYRAARRAEDLVVIEMFCLVKNGKPLTDGPIPQDELPTIPYVQSEFSTILEWAELYRKHDHEACFDLARSYVSRYRDALEPIFMRYTREDIIDLITSYSHWHRATDFVLSGMWLTAEYEPEDVTGELQLDKYALFRMIDAHLKAHS